MSKFEIPEEFAGLRVYAGGENFEFDGTGYEAATPAQAKRLRQFAIENPGYGIQEDGTAVEYTPEAPARMEVSADTEPASPEAPAQDAPTAPQDDQDGTSVPDEATSPATDPAAQDDVQAAAEASDSSEPQDQPAADAPDTGAATGTDDAPTTTTEPIAEATVTPRKSPSRMNRAELAQLAAERGVTVADGASRAEIRAMLAEPEAE